MSVCVRTELFGSIVNKRESIIYPGRRLFLMEHNLVPAPHQLIHSVSYSLEKDGIIEIFPDQIYRAAYLNFPDKFEEAFIRMLTEELLGQFCMSEMSPHRDLTKMSPITWLFNACIVDDVIEMVLGESLSKKTREHSFGRVLQHYQK